MAKRPHIVLFNPDQWRGDWLGHLGHAASQTPNLDQLLENDAVSFRHSFCQNPVCTPSRCSFMTGWYPHVRGHRTMYHMLQPEEPCLLRTLKQAGYHVWWGGKNDLIPGQNGYQDYCDEYFRATPEDRQRWGWGPAPQGLHDWTDWRGEPGADTYYSFYAGKIPEAHAGDWDASNIQGAVDRIASWDADSDQPLCILLTLGNPHPPYGIEDPWFSAIDRDAIGERTRRTDDKTNWPRKLAGLVEGHGLEGWSEERWRELRATYLGMASRVDDQVGRVLSALKSAGMYDDSAFFFFSDHGDFTGDFDLVEKAQNLFPDCLTRVPFICKPPKGTPIQPGISDGLTELIDLVPTVHDLAGIEADYSHFGQSLLPRIENPDTPGRDAVFCEGGRLPHEDQAKEAASASADNTEGLYYPRCQLQVHDNVAHTKAVMCRTETGKYVYRREEADEYFDLVADPGETVNRIDDPACAEAIARHRQRLLDHFVETADVVPMRLDRRVL